MEHGWIKLHRKMVEWEWYKDEKVFRVFLHLLLCANHDTKKWRGTTVLPGQRITSYGHLGGELKLGVQSIRTALNKLKSTGEVTIKTTNKYTVITILKWKDYQQVTINLTNDQQTTNKQLTTNKNDKNDKNESVADATVGFSFEEEMKKLKESPRKELKIIALYFKKKNFVFENKDQFRSAFKRELRPASSLKGYNGDEIAKAILYCENKYEVWTLETVNKRITDLINKK